MKPNPYWTATNLGEVAYRKIQAALAEDKAVQNATPYYTPMGEASHKRNIKAIDRIMADIDAILNPS